MLNRFRNCRLRNSVFITLILFKRINNTINNKKSITVALPKLLRNNKADVIKRASALFVTTSIYIGLTNSPKSMDDSLIEILKQADHLFERDKFEESLILLNAIQDQSKANIKWRQGRALYKMCEGSKERRPELIPKAFKLVHEALILNYNEVEAHIWMAALTDAKAELDGALTRLRSIPEVKKYILSAVEINPNDAMAWYALGSFSYGIANATWYEQHVLRFACPDISDTYEEALEHFLMAERISPNFYSLNILYIGKCYDAIGDYEKAKYYFIQASKVTILTKDDKICKEETIDMLNKYSHNVTFNNTLISQ